MSLDIYLARHEEALPGHFIPDGQRCLTGFGRRRGRLTGRLLIDRPDIIDTIWTSPLVRAVQTAEIYAGALGIEDAVSAIETIAEPPSLDAIVHLMAESIATTQGLMLVGHQPTLGVLTGHLLGTEYPRSIQPGGIVAMTFDRSARRATFRYAIEGATPTIIHRIDE